MGELSDFWNEAPSKTLEHFGDHVFTDVLPVRLVWSGLESGGEELWNVKGHGLQAAPGTLWHLWHLKILSWGVELATFSNNTE